MVTDSIASAFNSIVPNAVVTKSNPTVTTSSNSADTINPTDVVDMSGYQPIHIDVSQQQTTNASTTPGNEAKETHHIDVEWSVCQNKFLVKSNSQEKRFMSREGRGKRQQYPRRNTPANTSEEPS